MTLEEAIEIKSCTGEEFIHTDPDKIDEADRLSIEAMRLINAHRPLKPGTIYTLLPSETEE